MKKWMILIFSLSIAVNVSALEYKKPASKEENIGNQVFKETGVKPDPGNGLGVVLCAFGVASGQSLSKVFSDCKTTVKKNCKVKITESGPKMSAGGGASLPACMVFLPMLL